MFLERETIAIIDSIRAALFHIAPVNQIIDALFHLVLRKTDRLSNCFEVNLLKVKRVLASLQKIVIEAIQLGKQAKKNLVSLLAKEFISGNIQKTILRDTDVSRLLLAIFILLDL